MTQSAAPTHFRSFKAIIPGSDFYGFQCLVGRALMPDEVLQVAGAIGYALSSLRAESLSLPTVTRVAGSTLLAFDWDSTKSQRDDPDFAGAFAAAADYINEGSPVRTTNRAGANTRGTRLVTGIGECSVSFLFEEDEAIIERHPIMVSFSTTDEVTVGPGDTRSDGTRSNIYRLTFKRVGAERPIAGLAWLAEVSPSYVVTHGSILVQTFRNPNGVLDSLRRVLAEEIDPSSANAAIAQALLAMPPVTARVFSHP